jgi:hypothetical protein
MVGIGLLALFMLFSTSVLISAEQLLPGRATRVGNLDLPIAPSPAAFAASVRLHSAFMERLNTATAIYVLGGEQQGLPSTASRRLGRPLATRTLPVIEAFSSGLPMDAYGFYQAYSAQLGPMESGPASAADFSVVLVGPVEGQLKITALLQNRSQDFSWNDGAVVNAFVQRETHLYDLSGDDLNSIFLEKASSAKVSAVGARHFWYRYAENRVAEEGPATVIFPDPWLFAGNGNGRQTPTLSHFVYWLPISP